MAGSYCKCSKKSGNRLHKNVHKIDLGIQVAHWQITREENPLRRLI